ncbi:conjugative coupling factor TraD, PFGI-1 class [Pseudomonas sp. PA15(2017)]|uniref:type IV conjugative transfer system coupling protein TraD n=1 Tax=Pseudomonas sp. PA15(2017) TaxID=1932111 RepID=UPI00095AA8B2|nr:type IV conjugative transfer system coupling protein TraD [Pseudomonas sp. PA15(2017)]OLU25502.1 conjugative coupling factor TraD, PFGI-1 class [Pseudomonas sp. PA15(2017)]
MARQHVIEALLRPAVELYTTTICLASAALCLWAPWMIALNPSIGAGMAAAFLLLAWHRGVDAWTVLTYQRNIRRLPRYEMSSADVPVSPSNLFLGKGFLWEQKHTQRLYSSLKPEVAKYVKPSKLYRSARRLEKRLDREGQKLLPSPLARAVQRGLKWDSAFNPVRPLPPVGGSPILHGIEPNEEEAWLPLGERVGHTLVTGTTRVGKTRLAQLLVTQDIRRFKRRARQIATSLWTRLWKLLTFWIADRDQEEKDYEVVVVFDPKGDDEMLRSMYAEAKRAGRLDSFYVFHLGWPEISARYNAVGRFGRISEVASRISGQLASEGNSAAFKEFAWRFVNIVARARNALGHRPDYLMIQRDVVNIDALFIEYAQFMLPQKDPKAWDVIVNIENGLNDKNIPRNMQGRDKRVVAIEQYLAISKLHDPVMDGLRSAVRYDRTYFDKIVASLLPLLEKLTTGKIAQLLAPNYTDLEDPRPIFDWQQIIRKRGIVYIGLDALSDPEVASAVGNSMFADLVSVAGHIYKHGIDDGLPGKGSSKVAINLHCDEFNELMGEEFIPLINKGGGAGIQVTAYTQTMSDIEARIGNRAKAGQVVGNFNNLIMLRVRETATAELLTNQLPKVDVYTTTLVSGATDSSDPTSNTDFTSNTQDRVSTTSVPMIEPASIVRLPKGQAFALLEGGQLWKIRMPLPASNDDDLMPPNLETLANYMRKNYRTSSQWWSGAPVPDDDSVLDDLQEIA